MLKLTVVTRRLWAIAYLCAATSAAQKPENVLVVVNEESALSKTVGEYYVLRRHIPLVNVCRIHAPALERIKRDVYDNQIAASVAACLMTKRLTETVQIGRAHV